MKYEFHVGDYVAYSDKYETYKGYVKEYMKPTFSGEHCFVFQWDDGTQTGWSGHIEDLPHNFIRIGQYDFTKPEQPKEIKKLLDGYGDGYVLYKGMIPVEGTVDNGWVSIGVLSSKINELVDAVNELREKK